MTRDQVRGLERVIPYGRGPQRQEAALVGWRGDARADASEVVSQKITFRP